MTPQPGQVYGLDLFDGFTIDVRVLETRAVFGRTDVKVTPVAGTGDRWVQADKLMAKKGGK